MNEDVLSTVLDAGECAREHSRLLGFAVGYLHLRAQGVPVQDVIRMAKHQQRRINLAWSGKRWQSEHDRLSRAEALDRLARENVRYDVSRFEALLPARFDGYLIRTSRRLGMEGLRQRHCVAAYHNELREGRSAIATVFVDRQRWTVQLFATGDAERPLRLGQIRTRHNGYPSKEAYERVHKTLDVGPARAPEPRETAEADRHTYMNTLRHVLPVLGRNGVQRVMVSFDGYGDDGSISDVSYDAAGAFDGRAVNVVRETVTTRFENGRWVRERARMEGSVNEAIEDLTYDYLEETGIDWYNNDGGFGELVIDVENRTVALDVNVRYTESTNELYSERDILTGEDVRDRAHAGRRHRGDDLERER